MNIQQQIEHNRNLISQLPLYANFAYVWQPETLSYALAIIYQSTDTGLKPQNPEVLA